ncbi:MAG TPA: hypothetical protein VGO80_23790 [Solirubrobacteraceae bacterium]|jgi:uncharacterized protein with GYD domain|nr:hypothetical protein [Solirubrobacteraceae bacterium]
MPDTHVVLIKCRTNTELVEGLATHIADECSSNGGKLLSYHWTDGPWNVVATIELASRFIPVFTLQTATSAVTEVVVMRAFDLEETNAALHDWVPGAGSGHIGPKLSAPE